MAWPAGLADGIEADLRATGNPERAAQERKYLKSDLDFVGVGVSEIWRASKAFLTAHPELGHEGLVGLAAALWVKPVFERRMAATQLLELRTDLLTSADLPLLERLIRESRTWALVDGLAANMVGAVLVAEASAATATDPWATDPDFWVRRAALLGQLAPLLHGAPFDRFGGYADRMLGEREFFIRKAIGWVLRDVSKVRPDEVWAWIAPRAGRASGVTVREAAKYLGPDRQAALLDAHRRHEPAHLERT